MEAHTWAYPSVGEIVFSGMLFIAGWRGRGREESTFLSLLSLFSPGKFPPREEPALPCKKRRRGVSGQ